MGVKLKQKVPFFWTRRWIHWYQLIDYLKLGKAKAAYLHIEHCSQRQLYRIEIKPFDEAFYQLSPVAMVQKYLQLVEQTARSQPAQYYWRHRRFSNLINY